jgi:hypothetical protein
VDSHGATRPALHGVEGGRQPGCILGMVSDVTFLPDGEGDSATGIFRVFAWGRDNGTLTHVISTTHPSPPCMPGKITVRMYVSKMCPDHPQWTGS